MPGLVVRPGQLAAQGVDQVGLLLLAERAIQIAGLLEVLLTLDRRLLGGTAQRQLAVDGARGFLAVIAAARLVVDAAGGVDGAVGIGITPLA